MAGVTAVIDQWRSRHDVSILIGAGADVGRGFCWQPRAKVSMKHGHGVAKIRS